MCLFSFMGVKRGLSRKKKKKRKQSNDAREQEVEANSWTLPVGSDWRKQCKLHTERLHGACSTANITSEINSKSMTMTGQVGHRGQKTSFFQILEKEPEERDGVQDLVLGRITATRNLKKHVARMWLNSSGLYWDSVASVVNVITNLHILQIREISWLNEKLPAFR